MIEQERRQRMALFLGHDPQVSEHWPHRLIERLLRLEAERGEKALYRELIKLCARPPGE